MKAEKELFTPKFTAEEMERLKLMLERDRAGQPDCYMQVRSCGDRCCHCWHCHGHHGTPVTYPWYYAQPYWNQAQYYVSSSAQGGSTTK